MSVDLLTCPQSVCKALQHIEWHKNHPDVPHWYVVTVKKDGNTLFMATAVGCLRWSNRLGYALAGRGYWMQEESAQAKVEEVCKLYKDHDHTSVVVVKLSHDDAINALQQELEL